MLKSVLILGAGHFQLPIIRAAKNMGIKVIAVDRNPSAVGSKIADLFYPVDITDVNGCLKIAQKHKISGILPTGDISLRAAAEVAKSMQLPGLTPEIAAVVVDKSALWHKFQEHHLPYPKSKLISNVEQLTSAAKEIGFPLIFKPAISFGGSRGVIRVNNPEKLAEGYETARLVSKNGLVLIEEFLEGVEHTVECLIYRSRAYVLAISDKVRVSDPYCVATSLNYPTRLPSETKSEIAHIANCIAKAIGIKSGAGHIELITGQHGTKIVDFGARGGGAGFIPAVIVPHVSGVNMIEQMIMMSLSLNPQELEPKVERGAIFRFFTPAPGKVISIRGIEEALKFDGLVDFQLNIKVGDTVPVLTTQLQRVGHFVVFSDTLLEALDKAHKIEELVKFETRQD